MKRKVMCLLFIGMLLIITGCGSQAPLSNGQGNSAHTLSAMQEMPAFELEDLYGNEYSNEIFADYDMTMINIWGTFCAPCIREMPDIGALYEEMQGNSVNIIGVVSDGMGNEGEARLIIEQQGIRYTNLIPNQNFIDTFVSRTDAVPVTIFINSKGKRVGEVITGSRSQQDYREIIQSTLETLNR